VIASPVGTARSSPRILYVHNLRSRFVELDLEMLRRRHEVTEYYLASRRLDPAALYRAVAEHDLVFGWFASWHTFLPVLLARLQHKPSLLVVGGYDLANMPGIGYGHQRGGLKKWTSRGAMRLATCLVTNAYYSQGEAVRNAQIAAERVSVVYHGVPDLFGALPPGPRERLALTVGRVEWPSLGRKGHEPFVRAAALLPDVEFALVGVWHDAAIDHLRAIATPNVTFTGRVAEETLREYYRRAAVYVQVSAHEGFGMSVAEAMLAGCVPVVTRAGALPEVVGEAGIYADSQQPEATARAIRAALELPESARPRIRQRILNDFPLEKRQRRFEQIIAQLAHATTSR